MESVDTKFKYEILAEIKALNHKLESAFPRDEDGEPDYSAHKLFHKKQILDQEEFQEARSKIVTQILSWILIGALTILGSALVTVYGPKLASP